jgi:hypothetical protein
MRPAARVKNCKGVATIIARSVDSGGRPFKQYELCSVHAEQVAEREKGRGREIVKRGEVASGRDPKKN